MLKKIMINNIPLIPGLCIGLPSVFGYMCHLHFISSDIISPVLLWNIIVNWADSNGNVREAQIPEQCRHTIQDGVIASSVSDLYHLLHLHLLRYLTPMFVPKTSVWYCMIFTQKNTGDIGKDVISPNKKTIAFRSVLVREQAIMQWQQECTEIVVSLIYIVRTQESVCPLPPLLLEP